MLPYNPDLKNRARDLRKNMTDTERFLWSKIRRKQISGYQFYRQKNIGDYIVDFYCPAAKLIIELDGGQHYTQEGSERDEKRVGFLRSLGFRVLRFADNMVFADIKSVLEAIYRELSQIPLDPPLEKGEGG